MLSPTATRYEIRGARRRRSPLPRAQRRWRNGLRKVPNETRRKRGQRNGERNYSRVHKKGLGGQDHYTTRGGPLYDFSSRPDLERGDEMSRGSCQAVHVITLPARRRSRRGGRSILAHPSGGGCDAPTSREPYVRPSGRTTGRGGRRHTHVPTTGCFAAVEFERRDPAGKSGEEVPQPSGN